MGIWEGVQEVVGCERLCLLDKRTCREISNNATGTTASITTSVFTSTIQQLSGHITIGASPVTEALFVQVALGKVYMVTGGGRVLFRDATPHTTG